MKNPSWICLDGLRKLFFYLLYALKYPLHFKQADLIHLIFNPSYHPTGAECGSFLRLICPRPRISLFKHDGWPIDYWLVIRTIKFTVED